MKSTKVLIFSFLSIIIISCTTTNHALEKTSLPAFCDGGRPKQQHVFLVATYNGISKGIPITTVKQIVKSASNTSDFIKDHFIQALLVYGYTNNQNRPLVQNEELFNIFKKRFVHGWAPTLPHLAWVKENKFVICEGASCNGMKYPESPSDFIEFDSQNWSDGRCHDFFIEDGYVSGWGCRGNAFGLLSFMKDSGFNDGLLIANSYILVPDSQKRVLCTDAGLQPHCFDIFNTKEQFYNFREMISANQSLEADFAFMRSFNRTLDTDIAIMSAKSAFTKDLIIKGGTKISTKVTNDWTIYRISWDPTLFCRYARPTSDFYTH